MDTIKTAIVLVFLLAILYGAYVVMNQPTPGGPSEISWSEDDLQPPEIDFSAPSELPRTSAPDLGSSPPQGPNQSNLSPDSQTPSRPPTDIASQNFAMYSADSNYAPRGWGESDAGGSPGGGASGGAYDDAPPLLGSPPNPLNATDPDPAPSLSGDHSNPSNPLAGGTGSPDSRSEQSQIRFAGDNWPVEPEAPYAGTTTPNLVVPGSSDVLPSGDNFYAEEARQARQGVDASSPTTADSLDPNQQLSPVDIPSREALEPSHDRLAAPPQQAPPAQAPQSLDAASSAGFASPASPSLEGFDQAVQSAIASVRENQPRAALAELSPWSRRELNTQQREKLYGLLDPLAGHVIYSRAHLLASPHIAREAETLFQIAERYRVPWQLLKNINGLESPRAMPNNAELKVVPGPFRGTVDLSDRELTLYVDDLYAGRFPLQLGDDPSPTAGSFVVRGMQEGHTYYSADNTSIPPEDPRNPYGAAWIDLGQGVTLHGAVAGAASRGCLGLQTRDARDVYEILSVGSEIDIRP